ncbi:Hsp20 family protein [Rhodanobacter sp. BL-MT-08]
MRTNLDFAPLYRSSVGFDRVFALLENASRAQVADNWPPFDTVKLNDDAYQITMAVAGFAENELDISMQPNLLIVSGERKVNDENVEYLHRGIANRAFTRRFELADHVHVTQAQLINGLLTIDLKREVPEAMKPRKIAIGATHEVSQPKLVENRAA